MLIAGRPSSIVFISLCLFVAGSCAINIVSQCTWSNPLIASSDHFPWMVSIDVNFMSEIQPRKCEAVLISDQWLLTAAQCVLKDNEPVALIVAHLGKSNLSLSVEPGQQTLYADSVVHPSYLNSSANVWALLHEADFALLRLRRSVVFSEQISPLCLPDDICVQLSPVANFDKLCTEITAVGWGFRSNDFETRNVTLQQAAECDAALAEYDLSGIPIDKMCTAKTKGGNCHQKNIGGPLLCRTAHNKLYAIGVMSAMLDENCPDDGKPLIYSRICHVLPWIRGVLSGVINYEIFRPSSSLDATATRVPPMSDSAQVPIAPLLLPVLQHCTIPFIAGSRVFIGEDEAVINDVAPVNTVITIMCSNLYGISVTDTVCTTGGHWVPTPKLCYTASAHHAASRPVYETADRVVEQPQQQQHQHAVAHDDMGDQQGFYVTDEEFIEATTTTTPKSRKLVYKPELGSAAAAGHYDDVLKILDQGADLNLRYYDGREYCGWDRMRNATALIIAAACNQTADVVHLLLKYGAEVESKSSDGNTALIAAAAWGRTDLMKLLLDRGADINAKNKLGKSPLMKASSNGNAAAVRLLIERGADLEANDGDSWTALSTAAHFGHADVVRLLIDNGADRSKCTYMICGQFS